MRLPFHLVIDFAHTKPDSTRKAFLEFFGENLPEAETEEQASPLFSEWLIFDFRQPSGVSFLTEYALKNPDTLHEETIKDFTDVIKTHSYGIFEIKSVKRPEWIELENILKGNKMKVYDKTSTPTIPERGILHARIGKVRGKWYFVGSNPTLTGVEFSPRMKKVLRESLTDILFSPRDTWKMVSSPKNPPPPRVNPHIVREKREELEKSYSELKRKYTLKPEFEDIVRFVYEENNASPLDVWKHMVNKGIPEDVFVSNTQIFEDVWNYFPHKILRGKSPVELI